MIVTSIDMTPGRRTSVHMRFYSGGVILRAEDSETWLESPEKNGNVFSQFWGPMEVPLGEKK